MPPRIAVRIEALEERAGWVARIGDGDPETMDGRISKIAFGHGPDGRGDAAGLVEQHGHASMAVDTGKGVWCLLGPQARLDVPVGIIVVGRRLEGVDQPLCRAEAHGVVLEPVGVDRHRRPLADFGERGRF